MANTKSDGMISQANQIWLMLSGQSGSPLDDMAIFLPFLILILIGCAFLTIEFYLRFYEVNPKDQEPPANTENQNDTKPPRVVFITPEELKFDETTRRNTESTICSLIT
jgi:hypothetical protein